jgi:hypothetical protein
MRRGIIYIDDNYAEFGDFPNSRDNIRIIYEGNLVWGISYDQLKGYLGFDYYRGCYTIGKDTNQYNFPFGREAFPYNLDRPYIMPNSKNICLKVSRTLLTE